RLQPPNPEMSSAPLTASASTRKPLTLDPSRSRIVPTPSGAGIFATKAPKPAGSSVQSSSLMAAPAPSATRRSPGFGQESAAELDELAIERQPREMRADHGDGDASGRRAPRRGFGQRRSEP